MGSKSGGTTTQVNKVILTPENQKLQKQATAYGQQYANTPLQLPDMPVLNFNPLETEGQNAAVDVARGTMTDLANQAASTNSFLMDPNLLSPDSNPYLKAQGDDITRTMTDNLMQNILPGLRSGTVINGGFNAGGNTRQGLAQGAAVGNTNNSIGAALNSLYGGAYQNGLQTLLSAIGQSGQIGKNLLNPAAVISGVGGQQRDLAQTQSDAAANAAWMQQQLPFLQAQQLQSLVSSSASNQGVTTVTGAQPQSNSIMGALGGASSGASLGSMIMPGIGTVAGGGIGALLGALS